MIHAKEGEVDVQKSFSSVASLKSKDSKKKILLTAASGAQCSDVTPGTMEHEIC